MIQQTKPRTPAILPPPQLTEEDMVKIERSKGRNPALQSALRKLGKSGLRRGLQRFARARTRVRLPVKIKKEKKIKINIPKYPIKQNILTYPESLGHKLYKL